MASPVVEVDAKLAGRADALRIIGIDVFKAGALQPGLVPAAAERLDVLRSDALFLSAAAASWLDVKAGRHRDAADGAARRPAARGGPARTRRAAAHRGDGHRRRAGRISTGWVASRASTCALAPGVDVDALRERLARELPPGLAVERPDEHDRGHRAAVALVSRQPQRARAGGAVHRRAARVLDAGARGRAPARAVRAAARAGDDAAAARRADRRRVGAGGCGRQRCWGSPPATRSRGLALRWVGADLGAGYFRGVAPALARRPGVARASSSRWAWRPRCSAASFPRWRRRAPRRRTR